jgi:hypothetical protein
MKFFLEFFSGVQAGTQDVGQQSLHCVINFVAELTSLWGVNFCLHVGRRVILISPLLAFQREADVDEQAQG